MDCEHHLLNLTWNHHDWVRRVTATECHTTPQYDIWGRRVFSEDVTCHIEYVCRRCGARQSGGECLCDKSRGDQCPPRLAHLETRTEAWLGPGPSDRRKTNE
jgi:hypothetical protein